jgi:hypothetical protein
MADGTPAPRVPFGATPIVRTATANTADVYTVPAGRVLTITTAWISATVITAGAQTIGWTFSDGIWADTTSRTILGFSLPAATVAGTTVNRSISCCIKVGSPTAAISIDFGVLTAAITGVIGGFSGWETPLPNAQVTPAVTPSFVLSEAATTAGSTFPQDMLMVTVSGTPNLFVLYAMTGGAPGRLIRFNTPSTSLVAQAQLTFPNDALHDFPIDMVFAPSTGHLYVVFSVSGAGSLVVSEVDPTGVAPSLVGDIITDVTVGLTGAIATDNTFLYLPIGSNGELRKYNLAGGAPVASSGAGVSPANSINFDSVSNKLIVTGPFGADFSILRWPLTVAAADETANFPAGYEDTAFHQAVLGANTYVGFTAGANNAKVLKYTTASLATAPTVITLNAAGPVNTVYTDGTDLYACYGTSLGKLFRFDTAGTTLASYTATFNNMASVVRDGVTSNVYVCGTHTIGTNGVVERLTMAG